MCTYSIHNGTMKHVGEREIVLFCGTVCVCIYVGFVYKKQKGGVMEICHFKSFSYT